MGELGSRCTTERVQIGNSPPKDARAAILPGLNYSRDIRFVIKMTAKRINDVLL